MLRQLGRPCKGSLASRGATDPFSFFARVSSLAECNSRCATQRRCIGTHFLEGARDYVPLSPQFGVYLLGCFILLLRVTEKQLLDAANAEEKMKRLYQVVPRMRRFRGGGLPRIFDATGEVGHNLLRRLEERPILRAAHLARVTDAGGGAEKVEFDACWKPHLRVCLSLTDHAADWARIASYPKTISMVHGIEAPSVRRRLCQRWRLMRGIIVPDYLFDPAANSDKHTASGRPLSS